MENFMCRKCSSSNGFFMQQSGMQVGLYCSSCGAWMKWVSKKEQPLFKNRGLKLYPQNMVVTLTGKQSLGLEAVVVSPNSSTTSVSDVPFDCSTSFGVVPSTLDVEPLMNDQIEKEVEKRLQERLKNVKKEVFTNSSSDLDTISTFCSVCDGNPLIAEGNNRVEVTIFSGVLTVTDLDGVNILGLYKLKNCPECGKMF